MLGGSEIRFDEAWLVNGIHAAYTMIASFLSPVLLYDTEARRLFTSHSRSRTMAAIDDLGGVAALWEAGVGGA